MPDRPNVRPYTQAWFDRLPAHIRDVDESGDLLHFLSLIGDQLDVLQERMAAISYYPLDDGGLPGDTSALVDPTQAGTLGDPLAHLRWLAQLLGVQLNQSDSLDAQIDAIRYAPSGWRAGTKKAVADAARSVLSGTKWVSIEPRYAGDPWAIGVRTRVSETPDPVSVINAILAKRAKPAGFVLVNAAFTSSWDSLEAERPTWDDWEVSWTEIEETDAPADDPDEIPDPEEPTDPGDVIAPTILFTFPSNKMTNWAPRDLDLPYPDPFSILGITISFSEEMNWSTVTPVIKDANGNVIQYFSDQSDNYGQHIFSIYAFTDGLGNRIDVEYPMTYTVTVPASAADLAGNTIGEDYVWEFSTVLDIDEVPPTIVTTSPIQGSTSVAIGQPITIDFSEPLDPDTVTTNNFKLYEIKTSTSTPLTQAQLDAFSSAWTGYKTGYITSQGRVIRHDEGGDTVSEAQAYAMMLAVMNRDQVTFDLVRSWTNNNLKRSLPGSGKSTFLNCCAWKTNSSGVPTDWNFASDAELDRWHALDAAARLWNRPADAAEAAALEADIRQMFIVNGDNAYLVTDEYQVPNGHHQYLGNWVAEINPSYGRPAVYELLRERYSQDIYRKAKNGHYDMLTKVTNNAGGIPTTAGLPPNWCYYNAGTGDFDALTSGTAGWVYTRDTNYTYDAFRTVVATYQDWLYYAEPRAQAWLSGAIKTFFTSQWNTFGNIAAEYTHAGAVLNGNRYEKNFFTNTAKFALIAGDPNNSTAAAMQTQKLSNTLVNNGQYSFFRSDISGTQSSYYGDSWMYFCRAIDTGYFARLMKTTTTTTTNPVAFTLTYDDAAKQVKLTPTAALNNSANYRVDVTNAVTDAAANPIADNFSFSFSTVAAPAIPDPPANGSVWKTNYFNDFKTNNLDYTNDWWTPYEGPSTWKAGTFRRSQIRVNTSGTGYLEIVGIRSETLRWQNPAVDTNCIAGGIALGKRGVPIGAAWEIRCRIDEGAGFGLAALAWPDSNRWPQDGEWDMIETPKANRRSGLSNHHWASSSGTDQSSGYGYPGAKFPGGINFAEWHVFRTEWLSTRTSYYCDGIKVLEITDPAKIATASKMHWAGQVDMGKPGMGWIDVVNASTPSQVVAQIDWIRQEVYVG